MSKFIPFSMLAAVATITLAAPLPAQSRSTVPSATLDAAVAARPADSRAALTAALSTSSATAIAGKMGITHNQLLTRIAALDDVSAQRLADQVKAGGANVVISTTVIIIALLVIILLL